MNVNSWLVPDKTVAQDPNNNAVIAAPAAMTKPFRCMKAYFPSDRAFFGGMWFNLTLCVADRYIFRAQRVMALAIPIDAENLLERREIL